MESLRANGAVTCVVLGLVLASCAVALGVLRTEEPRQVVVQVHVATPSGEPVPNAPVGVYCGQYRIGIKGGKTDANGMVSITASIPAAATRFAVKPTWPGKMAASAVVTPDEALRQQLETVVRGHSFAGYQWVILQPEVANYSVEIVAKPASLFRGTIRNANGELNTDRWFAALKGHLNISSSKGDGAVELHGLEQGAANEAFVRREVDGCVLRVALTAEQCQVATIEVATITAPALASGAKMRCTLVDGLDGTVKSHPLDLTQGVTVVEEAGAAVYEISTVLKAPASGDTVLKQVSRNPSGEGEWFNIPPGTYYVGPGLITLGGGSKLWELVRAGRQAEMGPAHPGIVKVTIASGAEIDVSIDLGTAISALANLTGED